jgi:peptide/nickel transport system permease protein
VWLGLAPGLCIALTLLGINLMGDAVRDRLDPRMERT